MEDAAVNERYDDIIVGSGAGGAAAAYGLARQGRRVLILEKGAALPEDGSTLDVERVIRRGAFKSTERWLDGAGRTFVPEEYFNLGGKTRWYGAALLRFAPEEFEADAAYGALPWPIAYRDLAPYYAEAEALLGVREFPIEPDLRALLNRLDGRWQSAPLPLALAAGIIDDEHEARHFDGFASGRGLKADAVSALLARIASLPNVTLRTASAVTALLPDPTDARGVAGVCVGNEAVSGERVLLAAGALHSPRLLADYLERTGLARALPAARQVGRYFKRHLLTAVLAFGPRRSEDRLHKTVLLSAEAFPHSTVQPLGFGGDVLSTLLPGFLPAPLARLLGAHAYGFFLQTEDGSDTRNQVRVANGGGHPELDYDAARTPAALAEHRRFVAAFRRALFAAGSPNGARTIPLAGTAHACGTLAAGDDPARSVVDADGRVHGLANLHVVDGSVLARSSRVNPSLTIYAWALRVAAGLGARGVCT